MKIIRQSEQELTTVDSTLWLSVVFLVASLVLFYLALQHGKKGVWFGAGFFLLSAFMGLHKSTYLFDGVRRTVSWRVLKFGRTRTGELPFSAIRGVTIETTRSDSGIQSYRLALATKDDALPLATPYSGGKQKHEAFRRELLSFLKSAGLAAKAQSEYAEPIDDLQQSIESLLKQGRKVDAIALLRTGNALSLTQAHQRIAEIEKAMKAEK